MLPWTPGSLDQPLKGRWENEWLLHKLSTFRSTRAQTLSLLREAVAYHPGRKQHKFSWSFLFHNIQTFRVRLKCLASDRLQIMNDGAILGWIRNQYHTLCFPLFPLLKSQRWHVVMVRRAFFPHVLLLNLSHAHSTLLILVSHFRTELQNAFLHNN